MVSFSPGVYRAYAAAAAVIAAMLVTRHQGDWSGMVVLAAGGSDFLVLGFLILAHAVAGRFTKPGSLADGLNFWLHWVLALLLIVLASLAQALFLKTGEVLNFDILYFFLARSHELVHVATGAFDRELLWVVLLCLGMSVLASLRFGHRMLKGVQYLAFALPIGLVPASPLIFPASDGDGKIDIPAHVEAKQLYRGRYQDIAGQQRAWNQPSLANWRRGILTGMSVGSMLGTTEYQALAREAHTRQLYFAPHSAVATAKPPNIVFLLLESVRHDVVGAYAGATTPSITPFIDDIAVRGWRVERAYSTIPHTSKALVGIYCGTFSRFDTDISEAVPGNLPLNCLPRLLAQVGYRSAHFQTAAGTFEDRLQFLSNVGFDERFTQESIRGDNWVRLGYLGVDDRAMVAPAVDWMRRQSAQGKPFFASLLTIASHHPYVSPGNIQPVHDPAQARAAYLKAVRYTDDVVKEVFAEMRKHGLLDNTLVVITGDHGEAFAEHGQIAHNGVGYEEGIRVPLILHGPMLGEAKVINGLRQHIDIMPTVLDIAGIRHAGTLPGKSLRDASGHSELITACFYSDYCLSHVAADGGKLLYFHGKRSLEMYDLNADPLERANLYAQETHANALQRLGAAVALKKSYEQVYASGTLTAAARGASR